MTEKFNASEGQSVIHNVTKIGNKKLEENYNDYKEGNSLKYKDEDNLPQNIQFIDGEKNSLFIIL